MKTIKIQCTHCEKSFTRNHNLHKSKIKKGLKPFCSQSCATTYRNLHLTKEQRQTLGDHIKNFANNRQDDFSQFKYYINKCKERKKSKGDDYNIDLEYLKSLWQFQNGICPYTKIKMELPNNTSEFQKHHSLKRASLDRIDSSKGYVKGNVEFVCLLINMAKNSYSKKEVSSFFEEMLAHPEGFEPS